MFKTSYYSGHTIFGGCDIWEEGSGLGRRDLGNRVCRNLLNFEIPLV
jgi:hypothetical protein